METTNVKTCECSKKCGLPTPIAKRTDARRGHVKGQAMRFVRGHRGSRRDRMIAGDWRKLAKPEAGVVESRMPWGRAAFWTAGAFMVAGVCFGFAKIVVLAAKVVAVVALCSLTVSGLIAVALVARIIYAAAIRPEKVVAVPVPEKAADAIPAWFAEVTELQATPGILRSGSWKE